MKVQPLFIYKIITLCNYLQAHHLFKLHRLPAAHFYFFAAFQIQQKSAVEIRFHFIYHAKVYDMFLFARKKTFSSSLSSSAFSDFKIRGLLVPKKTFA
jgi:hypothetical protein